MWLYPWTNKTSMLGAGGGQSGTEVLMGTERGSCSEMSDPVTQIWRQCPLCWCSGKKFVFPWMEVRICLLSWAPLSDDVPNSTLVHSLTGFLHLSSPAVHLQNILTFHTLFFTRAAKAQQMGLFKTEIVPVKTTVSDNDGNKKTITVHQDEGIRPSTTLEGLAKLKPAFKEDGSTTAGQLSCYICVVPLVYLPLLEQKGC